MLKLLLASILFVSLSAVAGAHVPYLERRDYTPEQPFAVGDIAQSKAVYAWLQSNVDVDVYAFDVTGPVRLFAEALVPVCPSYAEFRPSFAVVGPGLPVPTESVPFAIPKGYGAVVITNGELGSPRETFYEPFGGKSYYDGPNFDQQISTPGRWYLVYWDPAGNPGDYVASFGYQEAFSPADVVRSLIATPQIRAGKELHTDCPQLDCCGKEPTEAAPPRTGKAPR